MGIVPDVARLNEGAALNYIVFAHHHVDMVGAVVASPAFCLLQTAAAVGIADIGPQGSRQSTAIKGMVNAGARKRSRR